MCHGDWRANFAGRPTTRKDLRTCTINQLCLRIRIYLCNWQRHWPKTCSRCRCQSVLFQKSQKIWALDVNRDRIIIIITGITYYNRPFTQLLPGLETGHPVTVTGQSPTSVTCIWFQCFRRAECLWFGLFWVRFICRWLTDRHRMPCLPPRQ